MLSRLDAKLSRAIALVLVAGGFAMAQEPPSGADAPPIPDVTVGPVLRTVPVPKGPARSNETIIDASPLPRDKAPQLDYSGQTGNFTIGQLVRGAQSGATGMILADEDRGTEGSLTLTEVQGEFVVGEDLNDESNGAAKVSQTLREGVWVLDFAFKPLRMRTVEIPGAGRKTVLYLYYRVVNHTGKPRMFVPQFYLVTDEGKQYPDRVLPEAVKVIRMREAPDLPLLGAVSVTGVLPSSEKEGVDDAVFGTAIWVLDNEIARSDSLTVYVRGLSDGFQTQEGEESVLYKTLRIDFSRPGDEFLTNEREIRLMDPPYEWVYY